MLRRFATVLWWFGVIVLVAGLAGAAYALNHQRHCTQVQARLAVLRSRIDALEKPWLADESSKATSFTALIDSALSDTNSKFAGLNIPPELAKSAPPKILNEDVALHTEQQRLDGQGCQGFSAFPALSLIGMFLAPLWLLLWGLAFVFGGSFLRSPRAN